MALGAELGVGHNGGPEFDLDDAATGSDALKEFLQAVQGVTEEELLRRAHRALLGRLLYLAETGSISHQEMAILRNMLRDNGMVLAAVSPYESPQQEAPPADLPDFDDPEYDN